MEVQIMRKDIYERMKMMKEGDVKPNFSEIARRQDCDYRTVKRYYESDAVPIRKRQSHQSLILISKLSKTKLS